MLGLGHDATMLLAVHSTNHKGETFDGYLLLILLIFFHIVHFSRCVTGCVFTQPGLEGVDISILFYQFS
jgi:hypothetical protein